MSNSGENINTHCRTIFKQTFKFTKDIPEQRVSPEGFLIRDCGCVMRFLPSSDNKLSKNKLQFTTTTIKDQNLKNKDHVHHKTLNRTNIISTELMNNDKKIEKLQCKKHNNVQHTLLYQTTFWMEPRVVPIKYTTEVNFNLDSPIKRFTETIDLQMKLVPCPYVQKIGTKARFKTSIETKIQSEYILPLDNTTT